jgi:hypothetical protein
VLTGVLKTRVVDDSASVCCKNGGAHYFQCCRSASFSSGSDSSSGSVLSTGVLWGVVTSVEVVKEVVLTRRVEDGLISPVVG